MGSLTCEYLANPCGIAELQPRLAWISESGERGQRQTAYRVLVASSGDEALAMCERIPTPIDALVTDVVMPGMGGRELADRVTERFPDLKVLFMTGFTDDEFLRRGILDQGRDIMVKPFSPKDLLRRLRDILTA